MLYSLKIKKLILLSFIIMTFSIPACQVESLKIEDYFIFPDNAAYFYKGTGDPNATQSYYVDYINQTDKLYQRRIVFGEGKTQVVGECYSFGKDGENNVLIEFYSDSMYHLSDMTKHANKDNVIAMKEPLKLGAKWIRGKAMARLTDDLEAEEQAVDVTAEVTGVDVKVSVPYGEFKALEITVRTGDTKQVTKEYYAKGVGLVKSVSVSPKESGEGIQEKITSIEYIETSTELERIEENAAYTSAEEYFFYPDKLSDEIKYEIRPVSHNTNEDATGIFERELKNYNDSDMKAFMSNVQINKIILSFDTGRIKIDFSKSLIDNMNKLSVGEEERMLQALVNTIGYFYYTPKVCITIDGSTYVSNNISKSADEYMDVSNVKRELGNENLTDD